MKHSLKDGSGYLQIDHSESPGLTPEDVAHIPGMTVVGAGVNFEADIQFCAHCGAQVVLNPKRTRPRSYCAKCNHYICDNPVCNKTCSPLKLSFDGAKKKIYGGIILTDKE